MEQQIYSVTQINTYIQSMMDSDRLLSGLCIRGEISNYKVYPSGHHYFSLKDATGALRCVMFKSSAIRLRFRPENGMKVLALGKISVFPRDGAYQLYCTNLTPDGVGDLHVAFEQLKAKLQAEGLFDPAHKKPLPRYPGTIAIITSSAGAAVHDMLRILAQAVSSHQGPATARAGPGGGGSGGAVRRHSLCKPVGFGGSDHHRPGRRQSGGPVGL